MYPTVRIILKQLSQEFGEAELNTFDGEPQRKQILNLPFNDVELRQRLDQIEQATRSGDPPPIQDVGQKLYEMLFPMGRFREALTCALAKSSRAHREVHLQLVFDTQRESALLRSYPWELMQDPLGYLHASRRVALSRYLSFDSPVQPLPVDGPLRVLVLAPRPPASAVTACSLGHQEPEAIFDALKRSVDPDRLSVDVLFSPTLQAFNDYLTTHQDEDAPHILHFDGHGNYGRRCPRPACHTFNAPFRQKCRQCGHSLANVDPIGYLEFYDSNSTPHAVGADAFAGLLHNSGIRLVVLSACSSAVAGRHSALSGVAQQLVAAEIPAVVAMQFSMPVNVALDFVYQFYLSLAQFDPLGEAMTRGRGAIFDSGVWFPPVLFLRSKGDTDQIFVGKVLTEQLPRAVILRGRDIHILTLGQMLFDPDTRGVLVHGLGGSGKTVLAAETALRAAWRFRGGVIWTEVQQKGVAGLLAQIADQIDGLTLTPDASSDIHARHVLEALGQKRYLLVVDGLEAALDDDASQEAVQFLEQAARKSKLLMTSRQLIQLDGINEYPLPEISPDAAQTLFWDHARFKRRSEPGAESHARRIAEELLGCHPLAIEIAAGITRNMTLARLEQKLEKKRLDLLKDPTWESRPDRLRDIFASFDLSYQTLNKTEQRTISQLATLLNPWTETTGQVVTNLAGKNWEEVRNALQDAALLRWHQETYSLHPLVKEFAYMHLKDKTSVHQRAANHLARESIPTLRAEAHYHAMQATNFHKAGDILLAVYDDLRVMGQYRQLQDMVTETLNELPDPRLYYRQAELLHLFGELEKALHVLQWLQRRFSLPLEWSALVLNEQARIWKERDLAGDRERAIRAHSACLKICETLERDPGRKPSARQWVQGKRANVFHDLGMLFHYHGKSPSDFRLAEELYTVSRITWAKLGQGNPTRKINAALNLKHLAELKAWRGYPGRDIVQARKWFEEAKDQFAQAQDDLFRAETIFQIAKLDQDLGDFDAALAGFHECEQIFRRLDVEREAAIMVKHQGEIYQDRGYAKQNVGRAIELYSQALQDLPRYADKWSRRCTVQAYYRRGEAHLELPRWNEARCDFRQALECALDVGMESKSDHKRIIRTFCALARAYQRPSSPSFPLPLTERARPAFERLGYDLDSETWATVDCRVLLNEDMTWLHHEPS